MIQGGNEALWRTLFLDIYKSGFLEVTAESVFLYVLLFLRYELHLDSSVRSTTDSKSEHSVFAFKFVPICAVHATEVCRFRPSNLYDLSVLDEDHTHRHGTQPSSKRKHSSRLNHVPSIRR